MAEPVQIGKQVTVGALAELLDVPASHIIAELFKNGVAVTINESIDFDTAQIIVGELGLDVQLEQKAEESAERPKRINEGEARPPVVAVMGHVDHGKTSLLDTIRGAKTAEKEAGGITQHISAYQIQHNGRTITLLDTPGHESFAALRQHGARLTDVAIIVIAADEGIKPQTLEAIRFAKEAGVKLVIAANKMDKPEADVNRLKQQLSENNLMPEDWGGDTIVMPVSARSKEGIDELLDMVLLVADVEELKAPSTGPASGVVIEAHMEQGRGPMATVLVEHGELKPGDFVISGGSYGKVRNLEDADGKPIAQATPSMPAIITGFKTLPDFGNEFATVANEKEAKSKAQLGAQHDHQQANAASSGSDLLRLINKTAQLEEFNMIIKADVQGSLTSIVDSLQTLATEEVAARVVSSGIGVITENDVHLASTSHAVIYGFHVDLPVHIKKLAARDNIDIRLYSVIYELIDDVKKELEARLTPEVVEETLGSITIKGIFRLSKTEAIAGGEVAKGPISVPSLARVYRGKKLLADELEVEKLQRGPQEVKEVSEGEMCGVSLKTETKLDIKEDDRVEIFSRQTKTRSL